MSDHDRRSKTSLTKFHERKPPVKSIRAHCLDCVGTSAEVVRCNSTNCNLWPFRLGFDPWRETRELTDEERNAAAERLARARNAKRSSRETF